MKRSSDTIEYWVQLHYTYNNASYKFNLPLPLGKKHLDGLILDFSLLNISGGRRIAVSIESMGMVEIESFSLTGQIPEGEIQGVFANGYQSWTGCQELPPGERIAALQWLGRFLTLQYTGDADFYPYSERKGRFHGYGYAYFRFLQRMVLIASLNNRLGYTIIETDIRQNLFTVKKDLHGLKINGREEVLELAMIEGSEEEVFDIYSRMSLKSFKAAPRVLAWMGKSKKLRRLDELSIRRNLGLFRDSDKALDYFIIGEGWQSTLGEWKLPAPGFPSGMASLGAEIRGSGYTPGIWFAPFVVGIDSTIFRTRKDWLAREKGKAQRPVGRLTRNGAVYFPLDMRKREVKEYISESYRRIRDEWRYELIYMDLLYAAAVYSRDGMSRGRLMKEAMDFLFSLKNNEVWVTGGVPLETVFGEVEYARIASDTTRFWEDRYKNKLHARERASTLNALQSTVGRRQLDGRFFGNALDSFTLISEKGGMEGQRRYTQLLLHLLFGRFISTSDNISEYGSEEMKLFNALFPFIEPEIESVSESRRTVTIQYRAAGRPYMCVSNLSDRNRYFQLPDGPWFGMPVLGSRSHHIAGGLRQQLKSGESKNYLKLENGDYFAGSDGHIFPGGEIASIENESENWIVVPVKARCQPFRIWIRPMRDVRNPTINGKPATIRHLTALDEFLLTGIVNSD